ncbi:MAG: hypothetical protein QXO17_00325 [Nitrososphaerota archaeon]
MRVWEVPSQEVLIFSSGKLVVAGSKSEGEAYGNVGRSTRRSGTKGC